MNLRILWMYHDLMDLYGDRGNIQVLKMRGQARAITVSVDTCTIGEAKDPNAYDLIFLGGGADREQDLLHEDLLARKADLACALRDRTAFLLICGGYQLFGRYYRIKRKFRASLFSHIGQRRPIAPIAVSAISR